MTRRYERSLKKRHLSEISRKIPAEAAHSGSPHGCKKSDHTGASGPSRLNASISACFPAVGVGPAAARDRGKAYPTGPARAFILSVLLGRECRLLILQSEQRVTLCGLHRCRSWRRLRCSAARASGSPRNRAASAFLKGVLMDRPGVRYPALAVRSRQTRNHLTLNWPRLCRRSGLAPRPRNPRRGTSRERCSALVRLCRLRSTPPL